MEGLLKRMSKYYIALLLQWIYTNLLLRSHIHLFIHLFKTDFSVIYSMSNSCDLAKAENKMICFNSLDFSQSDY